MYGSLGDHHWVDASLFRSNARRTFAVFVYLHAWPFVSSAAKLVALRTVSYRIVS